MITDTKPFLQRKTYEQEREHFIIRLKDRYGIDINELEYDILVNPKMTKFHSWFKKGMDKIIGFVCIKDTMVWVLKKKKNGSFATCYPKNIDEDVLEAIKCCFPKPTRHLANHIYEIMLQEQNDVPKFNTIRELGIYLYGKPNNILFRGLHISNFKNNNKWPVHATIHAINKIIKCKSKQIDITLQRKNNNGNT